jgi:NADP-dependent aldehyde dehydrogenase
MIKGVNFIGQTASKKNKETFHAFDPSQNKPLPEAFYIATSDEVDQAIQKAEKAFQIYSQLSGSIKADFLDAIADEIMELGDTLISRASAESGLPTGRFEGERGRTVNQLRMFAELLREGSWVNARIDTAKPDREPIPNADIRNMLVAIGPVAVFGASNFPLAFSTAGGDTASALAAGCPVVVKGHESHPGTNELVTRAVLKAADSIDDIPDGVFSSLNGKASVGQQLVAHPGIKAIGFTGSLKAGSAIYKAAANRDEPIPVYAEMGSVNPVFLLENKLNNSAEKLAEQYSQSVTLGKGQFCTKPGLLIAKKGDALSTFTSALSEHLKKYQPSCMLNKGVASNYSKSRYGFLSEDGVEAVLSPGQETELNKSAALATVDASTFLENKTLWEEVFGPFTLIVACEDESEIHKVASQIVGQLTITFMGDDNDLTSNKDLIQLCQQKAGRLIFNGVPTGVEVCHSMHHGGPYPATTDSKFTSVGTGAIRRFVRPVAYQDFLTELLPDELKPDNPLNILRLVDGEYKR